MAGGRAAMKRTEGAVPGWVKWVMGLLPCLGVALSLYTLHVEHALAVDPDTVAMCDINQSISCTRAFSSEFGRGFGLVGRLLGQESPLNVANSIPGVLFYLLYLLLSLSESRGRCRVVVGMSVASACMSVYLACVLVYVLRDVCIVCFTIHLINWTLLPVSVYKLSLLGRHVDKTE